MFAEFSLELFVSDDENDDVLYQNEQDVYFHYHDKPRYSVKMLKKGHVKNVTELTHPQNIFDDNADSIFKTVLGGIDETFSKLDKPEAFDRIREMEDSINDPENDEAGMLKDLKTVITTEFSELSEIDGMTMEGMKIRMRKLYLTELVEEQFSPMPDFSKDSDGTEHLTRRFKQIARSRSGDLRRYGGNKGIRHSTPSGWGYDNFEFMIDRQKYLKNLTFGLMEQFIYSTQYKLPFLLILRNKYKNFYRYKIGYCFALLRLLQQQQRIIYTTLDKWHLHFNNLMIHLKLYEKVVRLDVDIKDLCGLIRVMNYRQKLLQDPDYYVHILDATTPAEENNSTANNTLPTAVPAG